MSESSGAAEPSRQAAAAPPAPVLKQCCAQLYQSDLARWLLGESFHPGGLALTARLAEQLQLCADDRVLDVASGQGSTALFLAARFGCEVLGIDYGADNVREANVRAHASDLSTRVRFQQADAEVLPFADASFDVVICECAFCTFPDKAGAAREFARVLRPEGRLGISDLTRIAGLSAELEGLLAWIACIADAQPIERYVETLEASGFLVRKVESHDGALRDLAKQVQAKLLGIEVLAGLKKIELLAALELAEAKRVIAVAAQAIARGELGYTLITANRASDSDGRVRGRDT